MRTLSPTSKTLLRVGFGRMSDCRLAGRLKDGRVTGVFVRSGCFAAVEDTDAEEDGRPPIEGRLVDMNTDRDDVLVDCDRERCCDGSFAFKASENARVSSSLGVCALDWWKFETERGLPRAGMLVLRPGRGNAVCRVFPGEVIGRRGIFRALTYKQRRRQERRNQGSISTNEVQ